MDRESIQESIFKETDIETLRAMAILLNDTTCVLKDSIKLMQSEIEMLEDSILASSISIELIALIEKRKSARCK